MPSSQSALRTLLGTLGLTLLLVAALLPSPASGASNDTTDVAITSMTITPDDRIITVDDYAPDYHPLGVSPTPENPVTVTFTNLATFDDLRTNENQYKLVVSIRVECTYTGEVRLEEWNTTTYFPPYHWYGEPTIQQEITVEGPNPEVHGVVTIYDVYRWDPEGGWVDDAGGGGGMPAYVYKNEGVPG